MALIETVLPGGISRASVQVGVATQPDFRICIKFLRYKLALRYIWQLYAEVRFKRRNYDIPKDSFRRVCRVRASGISGAGRCRR
ncbi:hypothetical protein BQ8482_110913 [Mesorhizobium delmotii]|uniref:Uncharacterized protein n=1 Tax=Mesorhizobium delmotii TaxID=1631247 RepID=A0A2P9ACX9_9HYPH|nr:hypothetical protein BQ8482_110913 [Mesorhizobium delmotii]